MKTCTRCHLEKHLDRFEYDARSGRFRGFCLACATRMSRVRPGHRLCTKCSREKPLREFPIYNREKGWRRHDCQVCYEARVQAHHLANKAHRLRRARERYQANPSAFWTPEKRARANLNAR